LIKRSRIWTCPRCKERGELSEKKSGREGRVVLIPLWYLGTLTWLEEGGRGEREQKAGSKGRRGKGYRLHARGSIVDT